MFPTNSKKLKKLQEDIQEQIKHIRHELVTTDAFWENKQKRVFSDMYVQSYSMQIDSKDLNEEAKHIQDCVEEGKGLEYLETSITAPRETILFEESPKPTTKRWSREIIADYILNDEEMIKISQESPFPYMKITFTHDRISNSTQLLLTLPFYIYMATTRYTSISNENVVKFLEEYPTKRMLLERLFDE